MPRRTRCRGARYIMQNRTLASEIRNTCFARSSTGVALWSCRARLGFAASLFLGGKRVGRCPFRATNVPVAADTHSLSIGSAMGWRGGRDGKLSRRRHKYPHRRWTGSSSRWARSIRTGPSQRCRRSHPRRPLPVDRRDLRPRRQASSRLRLWCRLRHRAPRQQGARHGRRGHLENHDRLRQAAVPRLRTSGSSSPI